MISLKDILEQVPGLTIRGDQEQAISRLVQLEQAASKEDLCWCSDKNRELLKNVKAATVICSRATPDTYLNEGCNYILTDDPRLSFKTIGEQFFLDSHIEYTVAKSASIHASARIHEKVKIGHNVVIEEEVEIGEGTIIGHNTVIHKGTKIGRNVKIGCNNTIGGVGFGYVKETDGSFSLIQHFGNVVMEEDVEIGNNTCIDRAVLGSTWLRRNVKVDNLVHIAHGVDLGENSLVIANAVVAGSVKVGKNSWIAPSATILNKKVIGENATVGLGAVVIKDVEANDVVAGNPAKSIKKG